MLATSISTINVGIGELAISNDANQVLKCIGIGSCIALCAYDPVARIGGIAHMLLPCCRNMEEISSPVKYIDNGVPFMLNKMVKKGATRSNMILKIAGGAKMLAIPGSNPNLDIGQKNIAGIKAALSRENIAICGADLGGSNGRTIELFIVNGKVTVKAVNGSIKEL
ncbi:MAG: chemotaxis protein CheD [Dehalococcoidales bacterium]|nr:chemotaxis protein CheD [Dehalococcoidales bacterium]